MGASLDFLRTFAHLFSPLISKQRHRQDSHDQSMTLKINISCRQTGITIYLLVIIVATTAAWTIHIQATISKSLTMETSTQKQQNLIKLSKQLSITVKPGSHMSPTSATTIVCGYS